jgi:hypothetical protein
MARTEKYFIGPNLLGDIRRVVGRVDNTPIGSQATRIPTRLQEMPQDDQGTPVFRMGTFTSAWNIDTSKVVTFRGVTATPNTVVAHNIFGTVGLGTATASSCAIAKDGRDWYLIAARCV